MTNNETRTYIERQLVKLGWKVQLDKASYKKIYHYTGGNEERVGQLFYKLVSVGSLHPGRVIVDGTVDAAINDLKRMETIVDKAKAEGKAGPKSQAELDRFSIDQLAKTLETEVALEEKEARLAEEKFPTVETIQNKVAPASTLPRILVVDDSPTIRAAVTKALKNDFSFVQAPDGEEAWKMLKSDNSIQLVITDLMMPKLDGYELIKRIRSDRTSPRIAEMPIIVVTTLEAANAKLRALVAGANDFVTKSTDAVELKMRVMARYEVAQSMKAFADARATAQAAPNASQPRAAQAPMTAAQSASAAAQPRATQAPAAQAANVAAQARAQHAPAAQIANASAQARASQTVSPRNGANTVAMAGTGASAARSLDSRNAKPEARQPISTAAISAPVTSIVRNIGSDKLGQAIENGKTVLDRLAKVNPLTAITFGATGLIILIVVGIALVNRPQRAAPQLTASAPEEDVLASTSAGSSRTPDAASLPASKTAVSTKGPGNKNSATGSIDKPASAPIAREQAPVRKSDAQPAEVASTDSRTSGKAETSTVQANEKAPAISTAAKTEATEVVASKPTAATGQPALPESSADSESSGKASATAGALAEGKNIVTARAAAPAPPVSNVISQADLNGVIKRFEFVYEAGDIEQFLRLFDNNVRTNDRYSKDGVREDYEELFKTTDMRRMALGNVTWEARDNHADGWGNFEVSVRKAGEQEIKTYKGSLTFYVEKIDGRVRIKRMYHGQWRES